MSEDVVTSIPSSLYCDLFYSNPGADEFRRDHLEVWVRIHLTNSGGQRESELTDVFNHTYPGCALDGATVRDACARLVGLGLVQRSDQLIEVTGRGRADVQAAQTRFTESRLRFFDELLKVASTHCTPEIMDEERSLIIQAVERLIIRAFLEQRRTLELLFSQSDALESIAVSSHATSEQLNRELRLVLHDAPRTRLIELRRALLTAFPQATGYGKKYFHTLHRSVIGAFFLIKDPQHVSNIRDMVRARAYYLDSNVYLAWFYKSQSPHSVMNPLLELMSRYGVKLRMLSGTVKEVKHIEDAARSATRRAESMPSMANYLVRERKAIFTDYWLLRQRDKNLTWPAFEKAFMGVERMLGLNNVEIVTVDYEDGEDFPDLLPTFRNAIKGCKADAGRVATDSSIEHDADTLLAMTKLQLKGARDEWGSKHRFLSLDRSLPGAIREIRNATRKQLDHVDNPFVLASLLLPTTNHALNQDEYEDYVIASVQQSLGLAVEVQGFGDLYLIERLQEAGLPVPTLLQVPANLLESALADLQGRKSLGRKLDQAIGAKDADERAGLVNEIQKDLTEALAFRSELLQETEASLLEEEARSKAQGEKIDDLATEVQKLQDELRRANETRAQEKSAYAKRTRWLAIGVAATAVIILVLILIALRN